MSIAFTKMHGIGNDMIMIDNRDGGVVLSLAQVAALCDRHTGIGADGLILLEAGDDISDCRMHYYNADGSEVEMCGNGIRCAALFFLELSESDQQTISIATPAGIKEVAVSGDGTFSVDMGSPAFEHGDFPSENVQLEGLELQFASMGNPHAVAFVDGVASVDLASTGSRIEQNELFPNAINVHVAALQDGVLHMRTWERGSGLTLACGTGACAVFAIAQNVYGLNGETEVRLPGGSLFISKNESGHVIMRGPAEHVFMGTIDL